MIGSVIVIYKSVDKIIRFVRNEIPKFHVPNKVVIVNNASTMDESKSLAKACGARLVSPRETVNKNDNIFMVFSKDNLGYAKGNNLGAKFLNENFNIEYLLFSNDDIILKNNYTIIGLIDVLKSNKKAAIVGPKIINPDGTETHGRTVYISIWRRIAWNFFPFLKGIKLFKKKSDLLPKHYNKSVYKCLRVSGSFFLMNNYVFNLIDGFDPNTFLYAEEIILSERVRANDYEIYFDPNLSVLHYHGQTTTKYLKPKEIQEIETNSVCYYYKGYKDVWAPTLWLFKFSVVFKIAIYRKKSL